MVMTTTETAAERASATATYLASGGAVLFGLTANELAAYVGIFVAVLTYGTNLWFKHQHLKMVREALRKAPEKAVCEVDTL